MKKQMKKWMKLVIALAVILILPAGIKLLTEIIVEKWIGMKLITASDLQEEEMINLPLSEDGFYEIASAKDYRTFWEKVEGQDSSINGRLICDIWLNDTSDWKEWGEATPEYIEGRISQYSGVFDGNGYTIYGIYSEKGYGIVRINKGTIKNLTIRDSVIGGGAYSGSICYQNQGQDALISNCKFYGKIISVKGYTCKRMAGICIINDGSLEKCGFMGKMELGERNLQNSCSRAGMCLENNGTIENCYNMTRMLFQGTKDSFAIADRGERSCYMLKDSGWKASGDGQVLALDPVQAFWIDAYLNRDLNKLVHEGQPAWTGRYEDAGSSLLQQAALQDEVVQDIIFQILHERRAAVSDFQFSAEPQQGEFLPGAFLAWNTEESEFCLTVTYRNEDLKIVRSFFPNTKGMEGLWDRGSEILLEENSDTWDHDTYALLPDDILFEDMYSENNTFTDDEILMHYKTKKGEAGLFYAVGSSLYQIVPGKEKNQENSIYQAAESEICFGKMKTAGIQWKDKTVMQAVYESLGSNGDSSAIQRVSREELSGLEKLDIYYGEDVQTLMDLENFPSLTCLSLYGDGGYLAAVEDLGKLEITGLKELYLTDCGISDISFLSGFPNLTDLSLGNNKVKDISVLAELPMLKNVGLYCNQIEDIEPLRNLDNLRIINLSDNWVKDLSPLQGKTKLTMLGLGYNAITDISPLQGMTNLMNLAVSYNGVKDISVISGMEKLQWLGLEYNQIEDFSPVFGLDQLFYLNVMENPSHDIGNLYLVPMLLAGDAEWKQEEELFKVQPLLNQFPSQQGITAEDITYGDINEDGIRDVAITGYSGEKQNEEGMIEEWGTRKIYLFLGNGQGGFTPFTSVETLGPDMGGWLGDPYQGITISGRCLIVQNCGGGSERWTDTEVYENRNGIMEERYYLSLVNWAGDPDQYKWYVYDYGHDALKSYDIRGEWDQPVKKVFLGEETNVSENP